MQWLVDQAYPNAPVIRVVLDSLNTRRMASLYETFPAAEARRIAKQLEFHHTPKHASWLNRVPSLPTCPEPADVSRACRRVPSLPTCPEPADVSRACRRVPSLPTCPEPADVSRACRRVPSLPTCPEPADVSRACRRVPSLPTCPEPADVSRACRRVPSLPTCPEPAERMAEIEFSAWSRTCASAETLMPTPCNGPSRLTRPNATQQASPSTGGLASTTPEPNSIVSTPAFPTLTEY